MPLLVKIAPDLSDDDVLAVADLALATGLDGVIATNTTISRDGLATPASRVEQVGAGGLSGRPLTQRSEDVVRLLRERVGPDLTLVGVGGITTVDDARRRLAAGADLAAGLHRLRLRGPAVAAAHRAGSRHGWLTSGDRSTPASTRACTSTARWSPPSASAATAT